MNIKTLVDEVKTWMTKIREFTSEFKESRPWCLLGFTEPINSEEIRKYFDRKELNTSYIRNYNERDISKKNPYLYTQFEIDAIYSFQKSFMSRHKSRLSHYRDDCAQKHYHTYSAIEIGLGKFLAAKDLSEKK